LEIYLRDEVILAYLSSNGYVQHPAYKVGAAIGRPYFSGSPGFEWWLARGSLQYCRQPVFELVACNMPPTYCI